MKGPQTWRQLRNALIRGEEAYEKGRYDNWSRKWANKVGDASAHWYDLDDLRTTLLDAMYDKVNYLEDCTFSIGEISRVFGRAVEDVRYSVNTMREQGRIVFIEDRKTSNGRTEKRYMEKQLCDEKSEDIPLA
jgi:hypothetical protein